MVFVAVWSALLGYTLIYMGISGFSGKPISLWDALGLTSGTPAAQIPNSAKSSTVPPPGTPPAANADKSYTIPSYFTNPNTPGVRNSPGINPGQ